MVSHDLGAVERFSDRAALMERGRMVAIGMPREIVGLHLERLANSSPEIRRALEESIAEREEEFHRLISEDPEKMEAFNRALAEHPEYQKRLEESQPEETHQAPP
jgi:ABC-type glutathione transport system ATPase component